EHVHEEEPLLAHGIRSDRDERHVARAPPAHHALVQPQPPVDRAARDRGDVGIPGPVRFRGERILRALARRERGGRVTPARRPRALARMRDVDARARGGPGGFRFGLAPGWRNGSRGGLKIRWGQPRVGSNPTPGTVIYDAY